MNKERNDEREAKGIVESALDIELWHADENGGVDYVSPTDDTRWRSLG